MVPDIDLLAAARAALEHEPARAALLARRAVAVAPGAPAPRLLLGAALRRCDDFPGALALLGPLAASQPKAWGVHYEFGLALESAGRPDEAAAALGRAVALNPNSLEALHALAAILHETGRDAEALSVLENCRDDSVRPLRAAIRLQLGDAEGAIADLRRALAATADDAGLWHVHGHALRAAGRQDEAVAAYRRALALRPDFGEVWWSLANLKTRAFAPGDVAAMSAALATADRASMAYLNFALGKAREDAGDDAAAFAAYAAGNAARRAAQPHDADAASAYVARTIATFSPALLSARAGGGDPANDPIFIVGMPRSGSTLVEQMLASHSAIEGLSELPDFSALARALPGPYPEALAELPTSRFETLGRAYIARIAARRHLGRPRFVDKFPGNVSHAGLIHLALPNAAIIDVRRDPLSCCVSLFKQAFAAGQAYSYDLADLGRAYADYVALTEHFDRVLPGRILRVSYEALIEDPEAQVRRLLDHLGLAFEPACLRFFETSRVVRTASSEQVRQPINRDALDSWRRFEPWLAPLKAGLGASGNEV